MPHTGIHGETLEIVPSAKYLGLLVDSKLSFNAHVDATTKKANSTRAFLSRNFYHCNQKIKEATYMTYLRPKVEYAAAAWDPHIQRNIKKVEQVQRSSARFVTGNYDPRSSVTQTRLAMLYRIRFDLVDIQWSDYLTEAQSRTRGHQSRFWTPYCNTHLYASSFFPRTSSDWNNLVQDPADYPSLSAFKTALRDISK